MIGTGVSPGFAHMYAAMASGPNLVHVAFNYWFNSVPVSTSAANYASKGNIVTLSQDMEIQKVIFWNASQTNWAGEFVICTVDATFTYADVIKARQPFTAADTATTGHWVEKTLDTPVTLNSGDNVAIFITDTSSPTAIPGIGYTRSAFSPSYAVQQSVVRVQDNDIQSGDNLVSSPSTTYCWLIDFKGDYLLPEAANISSVNKWTVLSRDDYTIPKVTKWVILAA